MEINAESRNARMTVASRHPAENTYLHNLCGNGNNEESHPHIKDTAGLGLRRKAIGRSIWQRTYWLP
jgi:hypothetical protein